MLVIRQSIAGPLVDDLGTTIAGELASLALEDRVRAGQSVAVTAGSRGITGIAIAVGATVDHLKRIGLDPFIVPAMGSHGGATAAGQEAVLARSGITQESMGCPIVSSMDVVTVAESPLGHDLVVDAAAAAADHLLVVNRVKPHTLYDGPVQSGLAKMLMIGLGKHVGAAEYHRAFLEHGFSTVLADALPILLDRLPVLAGVALIERGVDRTAAVRALPPERFAVDEPGLLRRAHDLLPRLPFTDIDLLLIDEMGKEISGAGFDTNVVGRKATLHCSDPNAPTRVRYLAIRSLTEQSYGNAIGIGLAEFARSRVIDAIDPAATAVNALTSGDLAAAMIPLHFPTDAEIIDAALALNGTRRPEDARVVWIRNTLDTTVTACSATYFGEIAARDDLEVVAGPTPWPLGPEGNLPDLRPTP